MNQKSLLKAGVAVTAMVFLGALLTHATIPDPNGVIHGCYNKSGGSIRIIDDSVTTCGSNETSLSWNTSGPAGPAGPQGPPGPIGPAGLQGIPGPSNAYVQAVVGDLITFGVELPQTPKILASLILPAGAFVVTAGVGAYPKNRSSSWDAVCFLWNGTDVATVTRPAAVLDLRSISSDGPQTGNIALLGWVQLPAPGVITLQCSTVIGGNTIATDFKLSAIQTGALNVQ